MSPGRVLALLIAAIVLTLGGAALAQGPVAGPPAVQDLAGEHPAEYYKRASKLFQETEREMGRAHAASSYSFR